MSTEGISPFGHVKRLVDTRSEEMVKGGSHPFQVQADRDEIWEAYHGAFATAEWKQDNACSSCRSFIRSAGGIIAVDPETLEIKTLWDFNDENIPVLDLPEEYAAPFAALDAYVRSLPIGGLFLHTEPSVGVDKNADPERDVIWYHFHGKLPRSMQDKDGAVTRKSASPHATNNSEG